MRKAWHDLQRWRRRRSPVIRAVGAYAGFALAWAVLVELALRAVSIDAAGIARWRSYGGWAFAVLSVAFVAVLVRRAVDERRPDRPDRPGRPLAPAEADGAAGSEAPEPAVRADADDSRDEVTRVVESITDQFYTLDREWRITYVNRNAERFLGRSREDLIGRDIREAFPQGVGSPFHRAYQRAMDERIALSVAAPSTVSAGRWLDVHVYPSDEGLAIYAQDITERMRAEEEVRRQKARFEDLFTNAGEGIVIVDIDDKILRANEEFGRIFGYSHEDVVGHHLRDLIVPPDQIEASVAITRRTVAEGQRISMETVRLRSDGSPVDVSVLTVPVRDSGRPLSYGIYRDITDRKEAERQLRENEERLRLLVGQMPAIVWSTDRDLRFVTSRGGGLPRLGLSEGEVVGMDLMEFFGTDDADFPPVAAHRDALEGTARGFETEFGGRTFQAHVEPLCDADGEITGVVGVAFDVTDRKQIERALRESEEKARVLVEASMDGIFIETVEGRILDCNEAACNMFGYTKEELLERSIADLVPTEFASTLPDVITEVTGDEAVERVNRRKDGTIFPTDVVTKFVDVGGERRLIAYVRDISARKELEEQLRQAQKMEAIGRLAGGIAHDFNNLMMTVQGFARLAMGELSEGDPMRDDLLEIDRAADRAAELTRQLLAFGRKQVLNPILMDVNDVVRQLETMVRRVIGENVEVRTELEQDIQPIEADAGQVEQMIMNLALNARDAMPDGGTLTIRTAARTVRLAAARRLGLAATGRYVTLAVEDTGEGIDETTRQRIFEPFFTTKPKGKGTGLGLSTVYGIVKQSGGTIEVESEVGRGTTFRIYLPEAGPTPALSGSRSAPADHASAAADAERDERTEREAAETVLVVEDEASVRRVICRVLRRRGYDVLEAVDGESALRLARERRADIDLILSDLVMPRMSGQELRERLERAEVDVPIILMTGYSREAVDRTADSHGEFEILSKPIDPNRLTRAVRGVLEASRS